MRRPDPNTPAAPDFDREAQIVAVLAAYLKAVDDGEAPDHRAWLASHPDLADDLAGFLDGEERFHRLGSSAPRLPATGESLAEGTDFGPYVVLGTIARGGMGIVYRARHKALDRLVALKMILGGELAGEEDHRRFRDEAGAIAQLDHPNIVPIFEVGEHRGHGFYAMKLIEGGGLDRSPFTPRDPRGVARMMVDVARAVHHAHQRGILHRDLKPSNILIDHEGRPHVADFGLAKRLGPDSAEATRTGLVLGTPSYMAPEQTSKGPGALTTATDVYGLGAVLYALLAGRPPFRGDSILETIEQVRIREPEPPSRPGGAIDRDLQTICLTCLRKEPDRRYPSAAAMADDLERWLAGEPISARPMRNIERVARWVRREPLSAGLGAAVLLLAASGVIGLVASNRMIARERDEARAQRRIAQERSRQARRAVDDMYTRVAERWLYDQPMLTGVHREFLEKALRFYESLADDDGDPSIEVDRARALGRMAWIRLRLGRPDRDLELLDRPVRLLKALCSREPNRLDYLEELGDAYSNLGAVLSEQRLWEPANLAIEGAADAYAELVQRRPTEPTYRTSMALARAKLGIQYQSIGRAIEALRLGRGALTALDDLARDLPGRSGPQGLGARMRVLEELGCILADNRQFDEAARVLTESLAIAGRLPAGTVSRQDLSHRTGHMGIHLAQALDQLGRDDEAESTIGQALSHFEQLARDYPDLPPYQVDLVDARLVRSMIRARTGHRAEAMEEVRRLVERAEALASSYPDLVLCRRTLLATLLQLGRLLGEPTGDSAERLRITRRAIQVAEGLAAIDPSGVHPRHQLACARLDLASIAPDPEIARDQLGHAIEALERLVRECPDLVAFRQSLAMAHAARGDQYRREGSPIKAVAAYREARAVFSEVARRAEDDPEFTSTFARFLSICPATEVRNPARAASLVRHALPRFPRRGELPSALALACYQAGDLSGAIAAAEESLRLGNGEGETDRLILALAYQRSGDKDRARRWTRLVSTVLFDLRDEAAKILAPLDQTHPSSEDWPP